MDTLDAVRIAEKAVPELIRRRGHNPSRQHGEVRRLVRDAIHSYDERALMAPLPPLAPLEAARRLVVDSVAGHGPLQPLLGYASIDKRSG